MPEDAPGNPGAGRTEPPARQVAAYRTVREMQAKLHRWAGEDPSRRFGDLFNLVCDLEFLAEAWLRVKQNKGSRTPGIDGATVADIENRPGGVGVFLEDIRAALKSGEFRPDPVRQVMIPKKSGKLRSLGIATVADRVVQAALKLVLEPIFEADFQPCSYGFRPNRRAHDAIAEIHYLAPGPVTITGSWRPTSGPVSTKSGMSPSWTGSAGGSRTRKSARWSRRSSKPGS